MTATAEIWKSKNHVMVMETVRIPLKYQSFQLFKYIPVTLAINDTLLTPVLQKQFVALNNGLTRELTTKDLENCIFVEDIYMYAMRLVVPSINQITMTTFQKLH